MTRLLEAFGREVVLVQMVHSDVAILATRHKSGAVSEPGQGVPQNQNQSIWLMFPSDDLGKFFGHILKFKIPVQVKYIWPYQYYQIHHKDRDIKTP